MNKKKNYASFYLMLDVFFGFINHNSYSFFSSTFFALVTPIYFGVSRIFLTKRLNNDKNTNITSIGIMYSSS